MVQLEQERQAVNTVRSVVQREEDITDKEAKRVEAVAESARKDLEQALPQLQLSIEMLDALSKLYRLFVLRALLWEPYAFINFCSDSFLNCLLAVNQFLLKGPPPQYCGKSVKNVCIYCQLSLGSVMWMEVGS